MDAVKGQSELYTGRNNVPNVFGWNWQKLASMVTYSAISMLNFWKKKKVWMRDDDNKFNAGAKDDFKSHLNSITLEFLHYIQIYLNKRETKILNYVMNHLAIKLKCESINVLVPLWNFFIKFANIIKQMILCCNFHFVF